MTDDEIRPPFRGTLSDIDLRLLRVFCAVVEHGGYQAAEVALNKSKSAISLDMSQLEERLGARLAERGRRGFALTDVGRAVHAATLELFGDLERFGEQLSAATGEPRGQITLFLANNLISVAERPLVEALRAYARRCPAVRLKIESASSAELEQAVLDGRADLGISALRRAAPALEPIPLFDEALHLYCGRDHPLFERSDEGVSIDTVLAYPLVKPGVVGDPAFAERLGRAAVTAEAGDLDTRILLALSGAYLAFLPHHYASRWVERGELRAVLPAELSTSNTFHLVGRRDPGRSSALVLLRRALLDAFGA